MNALAQIMPAPAMAWKALGIDSTDRNVPRYMFQLSNGLVSYRRPDLMAASTLLEIDPDADRWRALFPGRASHGMDVPKAAAFLISECRAAQARKDAGA